MPVATDFGDKKCCSVTVTQKENEITYSQRDILFQTKDNSITPQDDYIIIEIEGLDVPSQENNDIIEIEDDDTPFLEGSSIIVHEIQYPHQPTTYYTGRQKWRDCGQNR